MPEYNPQTHTHFSYLTDFISRLNRSFDIFLIVERGTKPPAQTASIIKLAEARFQLVRFIKIKIMLWNGRLRGYKNFYVHYSFFSAYTAVWITRLTGGRVFYWNCGEPWKYKRPFLRDWFERHVYKKIDYLVTGTEGMADLYSKHYKISREKIKVMGNWIDIEKTKNLKHETKNNETKQKLGIKENQKVLLFVHRLSKRKGAHHLPEIVRKLTDAKNFVLLVIGNGPEMESLKSQVLSFPPEADPPPEDKLSDKVRFLGWVPQNEIGRYFSIADVFLMPSEEEGFLHVLL